jgi:hypothetical protein
MPCGSQVRSQPDSLAALARGKAQSVGGREGDHSMPVQQVQLLYTWTGTSGWSRYHGRI